MFPGRLVSIELPVESVSGIFVPQDLLFRRYGRYYLWTVTENDTIAAREVATGRTYGEDIRILDGVTAGTGLLVRRRGNEKEGMSLDALR